MRYLGKDRGGAANLIHDSLICKQWGIGKILFGFFVIPKTIEAQDRTNSIDSFFINADIKVTYEIQINSTTPSAHYQLSPSPRPSYSAPAQNHNQSPSRTNKSASARYPRETCPSNNSILLTCQNVVRPSHGIPPG